MDFFSLLLHLEENFYQKVIDSESLENLINSYGIKMNNINIKGRLVEYYDFKKDPIK